MTKDAMKEYAKEHAMSCKQVLIFDHEWTATVESIKAAGIDLARIKVVPKKGRS